MKNKIIAIAIALTFIMPSYAIIEQENIVQEEQQVETQTTDNDTVYNDSNDVEQQSVLDKELVSNPYKQPISKRRIAKKFLAAMFGVIASSVLIYVGLSVYNRIREGYSGTRNMTVQNNDSSLETPDNLTDAIKTFLDKTNWN